MDRPLRYLSWFGADVPSSCFAIVNLATKFFFREINPAIDEAARIEGCSHWQILTRIYIPCTLPGLVATAILNAIWIWNELAIALGLTFSNAQTVTLGVTSFRGYAALDWGQ